MPNLLAILCGGFVAITFMSLPVVGLTFLPSFAFTLGFIANKLWGTGHKL